MKYFRGLGSYSCLLICGSIPLRSKRTSPNFFGNASTNFSKIPAKAFSTVSGTTMGGCEFSFFSSGSKVRARREMPTSGPGGVSAGKSLFRQSPFPAEKVVVFAPARF